MKNIQIFQISKKHHDWWDDVIEELSNIKNKPNDEKLEEVLECLSAWIKQEGDSKLA